MLLSSTRPKLIQLVMSTQPVAWYQRCI